MMQIRNNKDGNVKLVAKAFELTFFLQMLEKVIFCIMDDNCMSLWWSPQTPNNPCAATVSDNFAAKKNIYINS